MKKQLQNLKNHCKNLFHDSNKAFQKKLKNKNEAPNSNPAPACPTSQNPESTSVAVVTSKELVKGLSCAAGTICGLAVSSGSYMIGIACGIVIGILKVEG